LSEADAQLWCDEHGPGEYAPMPLVRAYVVKDA